jgi:hypothetical protein
VGVCYLPEALGMVREDFPDLDREIQDAEDRVNDLWLKARKGPIDGGTFWETVYKWKTLHLRAILFYSLVEGKGRVNSVN